MRAVLIVFLFFSFLTAQIRDICIPRAYILINENKTLREYTDIKTLLIAMEKLRILRDLLKSKRDKLRLLEMGYIGSYEAFRGLVYGGEKFSCINRFGEEIEGMEDYLRFKLERLKSKINSKLIYSLDDYAKNSGVVKKIENAIELFESIKNDLRKHHKLKGEKYKKLKEFYLDLIDISDGLKELLQRVFSYKDMQRCKNNEYLKAMITLLDKLEKNYIELYKNQIAPYNYVKFL